MGVSEDKGYLILGVLIIRILLFVVLYKGPLSHIVTKQATNAATRGPPADSLPLGAFALGVLATQGFSVIFFRWFFVNEGCHRGS